MYNVKKVTKVKDSEHSVICLKTVKLHFYVFAICYYKVLK